MTNARSLIAGALLVAACGDLDGLSDDGTADEPTEKRTSAVSVGVLHGGDYLFAGQEVWSSECNYNLQMQGDSNLVLYDQFSPIWHTDTDNWWGGAYAVMQPDGNFVMYRIANGDVLFQSRTAGNPGARLTVQNDGNMVIYIGSRALWQTATVRGRWPTSCGNRRTEVTQIQKNAKRVANVIHRFPIEGSAAACAAECSSDPVCKAFTWAPAPVEDPFSNRCTLHGLTTSATASTQGHVTGLKVFKP